jgi:hypothetical protein
LDRFNFCLTQDAAGLSWNDPIAIRLPVVWIDPANRVAGRCACRKEVVMELHKMLFDEMNEEFWGIPTRTSRNIRRRREPTPRFLLAIGAGVRAKLRGLGSLFRSRPGPVEIRQNDIPAAQLRIVSGGGKHTSSRSDLDRAA